MKDTLRTRLEFLWAKLAGRDVDIDTLTPDAPTNMVEKLMLETADRIGNSGGGGDSTLWIKVTDGTEAGTYVSDTTFAEIAEAIEAGKSLVCDVDATFVLGPNSMLAHLTLSAYSRVYYEGNLGLVAFIGDSFTLIGGVEPIAFMVAVRLNDEDGVEINLQQLALNDENYNY